MIPRMSIEFIYPRFVKHSMIDADDEHLSGCANAESIPPRHRPPLRTCSLLVFRFNAYCDIVCHTLSNVIRNGLEIGLAEVRT